MIVVDMIRFDSNIGRAYYVKTMRMSIIIFLLNSVSVAGYGPTDIVYGNNTTQSGRLGMFTSSKQLYKINNIKLY